MNPRTLLRLALLLFAAGAAWLSQRGRTLPVQAPVPTASAPAPAAGVSHAEIGFRDRSHLAEHYAKHGAEFGGISRDEYLRAAQTLRDRPAGGDILESVRADGVVTRFDRASGAFLACDPDGVIRTFFRPNDGEAYFQRQLRRGHSAP
jgi:pyocin large subunit-like protein